MTENLPTVREGQIVLYLPTVKVIKEAVTEEGPIKWHLLSAATIGAIVAVIWFLSVHPNIMAALVALIFVGCGYSIFHFMAYAFWSSRASKPAASDYY